MVNLQKFRAWVVFFIFPAVFYAGMIFIYTYPSILKFSSHIFSAPGDSYHFIWTLWWFQEAVIYLKQSPWYTNYLFYPYGVPLVAQSLNPFNGAFGILLLRFFSLIETYNFITLFTFVMGGCTAFGLAYHVSRSYLGSLLAGFVFSFSHYHFIHAEGHMHMASLQWIPLFVLFFYKLMNKPSGKLAAASALALFAVFLCSYYYFFYCVLLGGWMLIWFAAKNRDVLFFLKANHFRPFVVFVMISVITSGMLVLYFLNITAIDPLREGHNASAYSMDLLAPVIPGAVWRFSSWTQWYWSKLASTFEGSVYVGVAVLFMTGYVLMKRSAVRAPDMGLWFTALISFVILSLGPELQIAGNATSIPLPYLWLAKLIPPLKYSGVPARMNVMVMLCASVIFAVGFREFLSSSKKRLALTFAVMCVLFLEYLPHPMTTSMLSTPPYVSELRDRPDTGGVIDTTLRSFEEKMLHQVIHRKPIAFGYVSRYSKSVAKKAKKVSKEIQNREFCKLFEQYRFSYIVVGKFKEEKVYNVSDCCSNPAVKEQCDHDVKQQYEYLSSKFKLNF